MKVVIFAGGRGTRISEESHLKPKPMVEIGDRPILWHIMKIYSAFGHNHFIICLGYKGYVIKEYFANYFLHKSDVTIDLKRNEMTVHNSDAEDWKVTLVETGLETMTAGRLRRVKQYVGNEDFMLTYGDGVSNVDIDRLIDFHNKQGKIATMTAIQPTSRFGILDIEEDGAVSAFQEKPHDSNTWINGGFFVLKPQVFDYLHENADDVMWERQPMDDLAKDGQLAAYRHDSFWKCMDTLRDAIDLNRMWEEDPQWKQW